MCKTNLTIPTREEFHREFAGVLTIDDFCTCHPNSNRIKHIPLTNREKKNRNNNQNLKGSI